MAATPTGTGRTATGGSTGAGGRAATRVPTGRQWWLEFRAATRTEPGRLRLISAALVLLVLVSGASVTWQVSQRRDTVTNVTDHSQPLSTDAAEIYRYLADADATAASGFLAGGEEPRTTRNRYDLSIREASNRLVKAASNSTPGSAGEREITLLSRELPFYTGLVETARANNRQGLPLGGAYLRHASKRMRDKLLPAAERLHDVETARLQRDYDDAEAFPWLALGCGVVALGGLLWVQRRLYRRTNRVFNVGLVAASGGVVVLLLWTSVGHLVARQHLRESNANAARSLGVLSEAQIAALKARGDENLTLVARGSGEAHERSYQDEMASLSTGTRDAAPLLDEALRLADDDRGRTAVEQARTGLAQWKERHTAARAKDDGGDYDDAVALVIGGEDQRGRQVTETTGKSFDMVSDRLKEAVALEKKQLRRAARDADDAYTGLPVGGAAVALLAAGAVVRGVGQRRAEYR
ncbi:hypothetical protein AQ490_05975 [Wenjunlia vitaminophila]|uniref:Secreted protein n=1 Tax=Wenjunlia vitaminophila TaxID=76728 RepID=A0A0T6LP62_WENVI|nr:hypothetical protein [Wenjunlia vitaminophila]KRV47898.1 hypothetical protein AQ490_05975 [Wenjunlia vitaminophila]